MNESDNMQETFYDETARIEMEGRGIWIGNRGKVLWVFMKSKRYLKPGMSCCEIGFGEGYLLLLLYRHGLNVTGIDISGYLVETLSKKFKAKGFAINLLQRDISAPVREFEDLREKFDAVFALDVLEHIRDLDRAMNNIYMILKPGGYLIATSPWKENPLENIDVCPRCQYRFHRHGHYHFFHTLSDILNMLGGYFDLIELSFLPQSMMGRAVTERAIFLLYDVARKTIFRGKHYEAGFPKFRTTFLIIARKK